MVDDEYHGQEGQCVSCGQPIVMPPASDQPSVAQSRWKPSKVTRWAVAGGIGIVLLCIGIVAGLRYGSQGMQTLIENRNRGQCIANLERIANALNQYAEVYGSYPPPTTFAADGTTPKHSWRVLILPYLGYQNLYDEYNLDEPWDSGSNQQLTYRMPDVYRTPGAMLSGEASYYLVTGQGPLFPPSGPLGPDDLADDPAKTILLVESASPPVTSLQWTEPGDLSANQANFSASLVSLGGNHNGGATVCTVDGKGHFLPDTTSTNVIKALLSPRGGEGINDDVMD